MQGVAKADIYKNNLEYLNDELSKLDLIINLGILRLRESLPNETQNEFKGLFLSDKEIDSILEKKENTSLKSKKAKDRKKNQLECLISIKDQLQKKIS